MSPGAWGAHPNFGRTTGAAGVAGVWRSRRLAAAAFGTWLASLRCCSSTVDRSSFGLVSFGSLALAGGCQCDSPLGIARGLSRARTSLHQGMSGLTGIRPLGIREDSLVVPIGRATGACLVHLSL